ncbi:MAG: hypothetical protein ACWA45_08590 [Flavobacteriales bacterium]
MKKYLYFTLFYLSAVFLINIFYVEHYGNYLFLLSTLLGLIYNTLVIFKTNIINGKFKFLSPGVIGVLTCFVIFNGGLISLMYIKDFDFIKANAFGIYLNNNYLLKFSSVAAVGNVFLWLGFMSKIGDYLFAFYYKGLGYEKVLKLEIDVIFPKILIVTGLSLNFILFINGSFGRSSVLLEDLSGPMRYLVAFSSYIEKLSLIGYFLLSIIYFKTGRHKKWYWITLVLVAIFALVSGARGPIIFLFILTLLPYYYVNKKISYKLMLVGVVAFYIAFTLASEIKIFTQTLNTEDVSVTGYADAYLEFQEESAENISRVIYNSVYYSMMRRLSTVAQGSIAIEYKDTHGTDKTDPKFLQELLMAPIFTIIPRSKIGSRFPSWGQWFRLKVLKQNNDTYVNNISFGTVAYFYLTGKWVFVAFGFFVYGVILRFTNGILEIGSGISFLVYLAVLSTIGYLAASIPSSSVSFLRYVLILPLFFYLIISISNKLRL